MRVVVTTPPALQPVTLAQAKAQCRATGFTDDDTLIAGLISTAVAWLDGPRGWLGRCLVQQQLELRLDAFWPYPDAFQHLLLRPWEAGRIPLPYGPLISVDSIAYLDANGAARSLAVGQWLATGVGTVEGMVEAVYGTAWPLSRYQRDAVRIGYTAGEPVTGQGDQANVSVPAPIQQAILLLVGHWYDHRSAVVGVDNRDSSTEVPLGVMNLLAPWRVWR